MFNFLKLKSNNIKIEEESHNIALISKYFDHIVERNLFDGTIVNDQTAADLDLDDVFIRIDKTTSKIGQQYLYAKIRNVHTQARVAQFDKFVDQFTHDHQLRDRGRKVLSALRSTNNYDVEDLIYSTPEKIKHIHIIYGLTISFILSLVLCWLLTPAFAFVAFAIFMANCYIHYKNKFTVTYYMNVVGELAKCTKAIRKLGDEPQISTHFDDLSFIDKITKINKKISFVNFTNGGNHELIEMILIFLELIKIAFNAEVIIFSSFIDDITENKDHIHSTLKFIGEIDSAISVSLLREEMHLYCKPQFSDRKAIETANIVHPLILDCVPNTITIHDKSLLLTGSNMAGKTTFLRAIGINILLAETLYTCFAQSLRTPFTRILSSIRITDDIATSTSYFLEEVLVIKSFIEASAHDEPCLFILDEVFKGTNTIERISAAKALLAYLNSSQNMVLVSSHDIELTALLLKADYDLYHFREEIRDKQLLFDYKLHKGGLKTRNAIEILKLYEYPPQIIEDALATQDALLKV